MIKCENIGIYNFEGALRGMRNPLESWEQSDSYNYGDEFVIGENDLNLALRLVKAGTDHSKFLRQIFVCMDIIAPEYFFKEFDTYKIATVVNSTSTMHSLTDKFLSKDDFAWDYVNIERENIIKKLNHLIFMYKTSQSKDVWRKLIQDLPMAYLYRRTWTGNYQILRNIYYARCNHKLDEWQDFCKVIEDLPYSQLITVK